jgi:uncharacterized membrane protein YtjA (UPF0391 family)
MIPHEIHAYACFKRCICPYLGRVKCRTHNGGVSRGNKIGFEALRSQENKCGSMAVPLSIAVFGFGKGCKMIRWAVIFLIIGLVAGLLGFTGIAGAAVGIAKILFFVGIALFVIMLALGYTVLKRIE